MTSSIQKYLNAPVDEAVDANRDEYHAGFLAPEMLAERLTAQSYRPEVALALADLKARHGCVPLSSLAARRIRQGTTPEYGPGGPPCIKLKDVRHVLVRPGDPDTVSEDFARANQDSVVKSEAVFINRSGGFTVGRAGAYLREAAVFVSDDVFAFLPGDDCDAGFVACFLNSWWGKRALEAGINGSTGQLKLPQGHVEDLPIPKIGPDLQRAIGNKVRKAERLREIAETRWQAATQLLSQHLEISLDITRFESFSPAEVVDAEYRCVSVSPPIAWASPADELGAQYFHPRRVRTRRLISQRAGWARLDAVATRQARSQANASLAMSRLIGLDQIDSRTGVISESSTGDAEHDGAKVVFRSGSILFSRLRPYLNKVTIWPEQWLIGSGSGELLVYEPKEGVNPHYLFFVLKSPLGLYQVIDVTAGSTHPRVDEEVVDGIAIPRLDSSVEEEIGEHVKAAHSSWYAAAGLIPQAKASVEALIAGTLDEAALLAEGEEIERWLRKNPSPNTRRKAT